MFQRANVFASESLGNMDVSNAVIINGAGPVGLTLACELARHGVDFRILEKRPEPSVESRALAIFPRTLEVFHAMGLLDGVLAEGQKLHAVRLSNESRKLAEIDFAKVESPYPFAISLPQSRTERLLEARLESLGAKVERSMELTAFEQRGDSVDVKFRAADGSMQSVQGGWLVGCDGAHSTVRHLLGANFQGAQYEEEFLLADVKVDSELEPDMAHLYFSKEGILAYFPFAGGRGRIIADQRPGAQHQLAEPTMEELLDLIKQRCPVRFDISDCVWKAWFRISHRMVEHFLSGRVLLAGDAAHIHSPAGGQGMNTGIQDAFNLGWKLRLVAGGAATPKLLDSYEAERLPVAKSVVAITDRLTRAATTQSAAAQQVRDWLLPVFSGVPFVKDAMAGRMSEVSIDYRASEWVENHGLAAVRAGDRAPDAVLFDRATHQELRIFDLLKTPGFVLLAFQGPDSRPVDPAILQNLPGRVYSVMRPGQKPLPDSLEDRDCRAHTVYGIAGECILILIRPDGYIGFRGPKISALSDYLGRIKGQ
jgi:2-polyprenyl-6-methoxyphenol hydroxylase-like FAD-dependent oxidoreductase